MVQGLFFWLFGIALIATNFNGSSATSLLCGRVGTVRLSGAGRAGATLALALVRPRLAPVPINGTYNETHAATSPCRLAVTAPAAAALTLRVIDVKDPFSELEARQLSSPVLNSPLLGAFGSEIEKIPPSKWSSMSANSQQDTRTPDQAPSSGNKTDACTLSVYVGDAKQPAWRLQLCGTGATAAARAGFRLLPPRVRLAWTPPTSPNQHTERLRLVVTAVNSGAICNEPSQLQCGSTELCVSSALACDGVWHCPGGEDEAASTCAAWAHQPPLLELLRRLAARHPELLGVEPSDVITRPPPLVTAVDDPAQKGNSIVELGQVLKPYGPWGYLVVGMLICASVLMLCLIYECCCNYKSPTVMTVPIPPECIAPSPTAGLELGLGLSAALGSGASGLRAALSSPPAYEPPPTYSSLFPRAFKSSPTPVPHCSHNNTPPD